MKMNEKQFDVLAQLMRGNPVTPANRAARLVLVAGWTQIEARNHTNATRQTIFDACKKYTEAFELVSDAWASKGRAKSSE